MASTLKTPGVYVEEISKFPPSVAQVETAIPAFIGYTEFAKKEADDDLLNEPTRITSLLEYITYFGKAEKETNFSVAVTEDEDGNKDIVITEPEPENKSKFFMYYSMQMYFANGGGPCWIIAVEKYNVAGPDFAELNGGLELLAKEDEPTLIVFPDAKSLGDDSNFYSLYNNALTQCKDLQDRFTIIDTYTDDDDVEMNDDEGVRNRITSDAETKKYGAVYFPYLKTILNYSIDESEVAITHTGGANPALVSQTKISESLTNLGVLDLGTAALVAELGAYTIPANDAGAIALVNTQISGTLDNIINHLKDTKEQAEKIVAEGEGAKLVGGVPANVDTLTTKVDTLTTKIETKLTQYVSDFEALKTNLTDATSHVDISSELTDTIAKLGEVDISTDIITPSDAVLTAVGTIAGNLIIPNPGLLYGNSLESSESIDNESYNAIKKELNKIKVVLPPSSSVAGVYARVDSDRGVWKAPANVSLNYVIKPTVKVTHELNGRLNIATSGKSINAIRSFTGKGTLVWGARTLAGNDNEWRYVPVRRFFNMVEESVKKASEQFVFEPNDANTWVKIRAMIENFLTNQWRAGALAGAKADDAFYVRIGLNQTMTAQDILNGIMNIEIGMAAVRPAEFIVLKFSHKMQEA